MSNIRKGDLTWKEFKKDGSLLLLRDLFMIFSYCFGCTYVFVSALLYEDNLRETILAMTCLIFLYDRVKRAIKNIQVNPQTGKYGDLVK